MINYVCKIINVTYNIHVPMGNKPPEFFKTIQDKTDRSLAVSE